MARSPAGQPVRVSWRTTQPDGTTLVNATANSLTVRLRNADGTTTPTAGSPYAAPVNDATGLYHQDLPASDLSAAGHYQWANTATGTGAGVTYGEFDVFDPAEPAVLGLQDAKDHLNITVATYDSELLSWIADIENSLEALTGGPLLDTIITNERAEFSRDMTTLQVRLRPVVSVTSITSIPNGAAVDISAGLDIDPLTSEIRTKGGWAFSAFSPLVLAAYVAGWGASVPAAFNGISRIIVADLWETQHGPAARPSQGQPPDARGYPYDIPARAAELLHGSLNGIPFMAQVFA